MLMGEEEVMVYMFDPMTFQSHPVTFRVPILFDSEMIVEKGLMSCQNPLSLSGDAWGAVRIPWVCLGCPGGSHWFI